jgi:hypothetical protein
MPLDNKDREYIVSSAVDILRHRRRDRLLTILEERMSHGDYDELHEEDLDRVVLALVKAVDDELGPTDR